MQTNRGEDAHYADCLKSKAELSINGSLAFFYWKKWGINVDMLVSSIVLT
jgi:hypothetical protein